MRYPDLDLDLNMGVSDRPPHTRPKWTVISISKICYWLAVEGLLPRGFSVARAADAGGELREIVRMVRRSDDCSPCSPTFMVTRCLVCRGISNRRVS